MVVYSQWFLAYNDKHNNHSPLIQEVDEDTITHSITHKKENSIDQQLHIFLNYIKISGKIDDE